MRPAAQIGKIALRIKANAAIFQIAQQVKFVFVAFFGKIGYSIRFAHLGAHKGRLLLCQIFHLVFNGHQIFLGQLSLAQINIVVKPGWVNGWRAHPKLYARKQRLNGFGH